MEIEDRTIDKDVVCWIITGGCGLLMRDMEHKMKKEHFAVANFVLEALCDGMANMDKKDWEKMVDAAWYSTDRDKKKRN